MRVILLALALGTALATGATIAQESPPASAALEQHEWLQQLVGEWTVSSDAVMGPDGESVLWESTESVRSIGGLWVVAEGSADNYGEPFTSLLTLGYDETGPSARKTPLSSRRGCSSLVPGVGSSF